MSSLSQSIFKAYDIRGIVDQTLTEPVMFAIGRALADICAAQQLTQFVVGRDGRLSGLRLQAALIQGLRAGGVDVIDIGLVTTPVVYWATYHLNTGCGAMITGSHNPPQYNGIKMMVGGDAIWGEAILAIYQRAQQYLHAEAMTAAATGGYRAWDALPDYIARAVSDIDLPASIKVAVDSGNGAAGAVAPRALRALNVPMIELFSEVDGNFPNHHPDPAHIENLQDLMQCLRSTDAEIGLAFDGDGDRLGLVSKSGHVIFPDRQMMLFARDVLSRNPGAPIVFDVKCSRLLADEIRKAGGEAVMYKTGHSLVKAKIKAINSPLGGEMSGHIFFKDRWYGFDDGVYAALRLLEILSKAKAAGQDINALLENLPNSTSTPELNVALQEGEPHSICAALQATGQFDDATQVHTIDGVRAEWADGFGLARASNTTPVIVLRFEADNAAALARIQAVFARELRKHKPEMSLPF